MLKQATEPAPDVIDRAVTEGRAAQVRTMIMAWRYTTPKLLERMLEVHLRRAAFKDATATEGTRYVSEGGVSCLRVGLFKWPQIAMSWGELKSYERALAELPGVVRTEIVHDCQGINPRDQVIVIHRRMWEEQ